MEEIEKILMDICGIKRSIVFFEDRIKKVEQSEDNLLFEHFIGDGEPPILMTIPKAKVMMELRERLNLLCDDLRNAKLEAIEEFHRLEKEWTSTEL